MKKETESAINIIKYHPDGKLDFYYLYFIYFK